MDNNRFKELFGRYLEHQLSESEENELMRDIYALSDKELESFLDNCYDNAPANHSIDREDADRIFNTIVRTARQKRNRLIIKRITTLAASVVLLLSAGYFIINALIENSEKFSIAQDITPGGEKAVLTLSDGSVVELTSSKDSILMNKENDVVIKVQNNKLLYEKKTKAKSSEIKYNTLTTPRSAEYQMTLPDGTNVWLNAESSIMFPVSFSSKERKVYITGEVYFEVTKTVDKRPFIVELADKAKIEVLGTHFNINAYDNEAGVRTTLIEGSVKVESLVTSDSFVITPGQQATISKNGQLSVGVVDIEEAIAWKNGRFIFEKADIYTIMRQLERWYNVRVEFEGAINTHFGGAISRKVNISKIFEMLEMTNEVKFKLNDSTVTVLGK